MTIDQDAETLRRGIGWKWTRGNQREHAALDRILAHYAEAIDVLTKMTIQKDARIARLERDLREAEGHRDYWHDLHLKQIARSTELET